VPPSASASFRGLSALSRAPPHEAIPAKIPKAAAATSDAWGCIDSFYHASSRESVPLLVGAKSTNGGVILSDLDEVAVYGTALSGERVTAHFDAGRLR